MEEKIPGLKPSLSDQKMVSIDVVIPSYRFNESIIRSILELEIPPFGNINFILIIDQPGLSPSDEMNQLIQAKNVIVLFNDTNCGASVSRNKGIRTGTAEWILFLDDDIEVPSSLLCTYADAAQRYPHETGFIGLVKLPPPSTDFSRAILASGAMDIFSIASKKEYFAWGATANIMIRRSALGSLTFSTVYPKSGGGEDVDLFLRLRKQNNYRDFKTLPAAVVYHPWWNNEQPDYKKPFRYGIGNSWLGQLNPEHTYRDFLNTPETVLLLIVATVFVAVLAPAKLMTMVYLFAGVLLIELIANLLQTMKRMPGSSLQVALYVMLLRLAQETGVLWGKTSRGRPDLIGLRIHDNGLRQKIYFYRSNTYRTVKWILYPLLALLIWKFF